MRSTVVFDLIKNETFLTDVSYIGKYFSVWIIFAFLLFSLGLFGMLFNYKNFLITMMSVELMYLGVIVSFVLHGVSCNDARGAVYALALLIMAACESAIGLGILIVIYRFGHTVDFRAYEELGG